MTHSELLLAVLRGVHVAAIFSLFGTLLFGELGGSAALTRALRRLARASAIVALAAGVLWFALNARAMAGSESVRDSFAALVLVARDTQFGMWLLIRLAILIAALLIIKGRRIALLLAAAALLVQPELAHAGAIGGNAGLLLTASEVLHMLAAGAWLGGLIPLAMTVTMLPPPQSAQICRRFSSIALSAVLVLAATGTIQAGVLLGGLRALTGTNYGRVLLVKLALLLCALALAGLNRFRLTSRVASSVGARLQMRQSLTAEAVFGLFIVLAAACLASLPPGGAVGGAWLLSPPAIPVLAAAGMTLGIAALPLLRRYS
ncbi:MAG TPA: CopD family protein [Acetobacteraceae bacterium]|nr:CopD family protein [Acetobacteraceae bacterium]